MKRTAVTNFLKLPVIVLISIFLIISGCAKKGDPGPEGPVGDAGVQGPVGPAGAAGSVILSGTGVPAATLGKNGDFYLDKTASNLYGPKANSAWGTPVSLKGANGATGATGAAGTTILSGTVVPAAGTGKVGDFYLNITTFNFYGPKTAAGWGTPVNLKGPQGNANVVSGTFTLTNADYVSGYWTIATGPFSSLGQGAKVATKNIPGITTAIFNTGTVLLYLKVPASLGATLINWASVPFDVAGFTVGYFTSIRNAYKVGSVQVYYLYTPTDAAATVPSIFSATVPDYTFKYVLIAGTPGARQSAPPVDYTSYEAVKAYYHLAD